MFKATELPSKSVKFSFSIFFVLLAGVCIASTANAEPVQKAGSQPEIKVGFLLSLTGGLEQWCGYIKKGMDLASAEIQAGRDYPKVVVQYEDDQSIDRRAMAAAAQKLLSVDKVDLLGTWTNSAIPTLLPIAEKAKTPFVVGAYDHNVKNGGPWIFGTFVNYDLVPREIAKLMIEKRNKKKLALILADDYWSQSFEPSFRDEIKKLGAELVMVEKVAADESDLRSLVIRLREKGIDGVLAALYGSSQYSFLKQARDLKFTGLIHVGDGMFEEDIKIAGSSAEGVYTTQIWLQAPTLLKKLQDKYGETANVLQLGLAATGYDFIMHIHRAAQAVLESGKELTRENIRDALRVHSSNGYTGELMFGGPPKTSGEVQMVVRGGKFELVGE